MKPAFPVRLIAGAAVTLLFVVIFVALLMATETLLTIWEKLANLAPWAVGMYALALLGAVGMTAWIWIRLFFRRPGKKRSDNEPLTRSSLEQRLQQAKEQGVNTAITEKELAETQKRQRSGRIYVALFGGASEGKSSLINALAPQEHRPVDVIAGTTTARYEAGHTAQLGEQVTLVDLPGFGFGDEALERLAREEALRAHLILYVASGDLDRTQMRELSHLLAFNKPTIVVVNKADRYTQDELTAIRRRLVTRVGETIPVVQVVAGGTEQVVVVEPDGSEQTELRARNPDFSHLVDAIRDLADADRLGEQHEESALQIAAEQLDQAVNAHRSVLAEELVNRYARRAVIGALAALTPGSDIVIQGALATKLYHDLCRLYDQPPRSIDLDRFLQLAGGRVRKATAITLAVAGNALKAFPGIGTVSGGLVHAVAYGMIFHSLGRAASQALASGNPPDERTLAKQFGEEVQRRKTDVARQLARVALDELRGGGNGERG